MIMVITLVCFCPFGRHVSLSVNLHDIVVGDPADGALVAPASTLNARCHVATRDESRIALVLVAEFAHFSLTRWGA